MVLLIVAGLLVPWIVAGFHYTKGSALLHFIGHVLSCSALIAILWAFIVYPVLHCSSYLCGFGEYLVFILLAGLIVLIWGLRLLLYSNKNFANSKENLYTGRHDIVNPPKPKDKEF